MNKYKKTAILILCLLPIVFLIVFIYKNSQNRDDSSGRYYYSIEEFETDTGIDFYPYNDFYQFLQNKNISLKDTISDVEIFVTYDDVLYFIRPKDSYVEYTVSYDTSSYIDTSIYDEYEMKNGILYICSEENNNTSFEAQYISEKVRYSIFYMNENNNFSYNYLKEKMIEYAKYFEAK